MINIRYGGDKMAKIDTTSNIRTICWDLGYSKAKTEQFMIPSVVGNARDIRFKSGLTGDKLYDNLSVKYKGVSYYVGDLARRQSDQVIQSLDEDRYKNIETNVLMETIMGLLTGNGSVS